MLNKAKQTDEIGTRSQLKLEDPNQNQLSMLGEGKDLIYCGGTELTWGSITICSLHGLIPC